MNALLDLPTLSPLKYQSGAMGHRSIRTLAWGSCKASDLQFLETFNSSYSRESDKHPMTSPFGNSRLGMLNAKLDFRIIPKWSPRSFWTRCRFHQIRSYTKAATGSLHHWSPTQLWKTANEQLLYKISKVGNIVKELCRLTSIWLRFSLQTGLVGFSARCSNRGGRPSASSVRARHISTILSIPDLHYEPNISILESLNGAYSAFAPSRSRGLHVCCFHRFKPR